MLPRIIPRPAKALTTNPSGFLQNCSSPCWGPSTMSHFKTSHGQNEREIVRDAQRKSLKQDEKHPSTLTPCHDKVRREITPVQHDHECCSEQDREHAQDRRSRFTRENNHRDHFQGRLMFQPPDMKNWAYRRPAGGVINKVRNCQDHEQNGRTNEEQQPHTQHLQSVANVRWLFHNRLSRKTSRCVRFFFFSCFSLCFVRLRPGTYAHTFFSIEGNFQSRHHAEQWDACLALNAARPGPHVGKHICNNRAQRHFTMPQSRTQSSDR